MLESVPVIKSFQTLLGDLFQFKHLNVLWYDYFENISKQLRLKFDEYLPHDSKKGDKIKLY